MGRRKEGATIRTHTKCIRLDDDGVQMLERNRARRGLEISDYFRTLMEEDRYAEQG
jgi:hypothetical protein